MTNIQDPYSQSSKIFNAYAENQSLDASMTFLIPVLDNMPNKTIKPSKLGTTDPNLYYANISSTLAARTAPNGGVIRYLSKDDRVKMLARKVHNDGTNEWDKVLLWTGQEAYVASSNLEPFNVAEVPSNVTGISLDASDISIQVGTGAQVTSANIIATVLPENANNKNVVWKSSNTNVATIDNGHIVAVAVGTTEISVTTTEGNKVAKCNVTVTDFGNTKLAVVTTDKLNIRKEANTTSTVIGQVLKSEQVTILQENVKNDGTYIWDKIQLNNGRVGYIANKYLEKLELYKIDLVAKTIKMTPSVSIGNIKKEIPNLEVKTSSDEIKQNNNDLIGTGYKVLNKDTNILFTAIKMGDANGDAKVSAGDYVKIRNAIMNSQDFTAEYKIAADINKDGKVSAGDYVRIRNYIMNGTAITI